METTTIKVDTDRITPSSVRNERSLWERRVSSAIRAGSLSDTPRRTLALPNGRAIASPALAGAAPPPDCGFCDNLPKTPGGRHTPASTPGAPVILRDENHNGKFHVSAEISSS